MAANPQAAVATAGVTEAHSELVRMEGVSKHYAGVAALSGVDFAIRAGEIHALVGENGAGKSTMVKVLASIVSPDEGRVVVTDAGRSAERAASSPLIAVVHQELSIVPALSVLDNLLLGDERVGPLCRRRRFREEMRRHLDAVGLEHVALDVRAEQLTLAEQQLVEIARSLARDARVTILDEPTATLSDNEIERVFAVLNRLRDQGHAVVYISHRLREIFAMADRVTTLRNGRVVSTAPIAEVTQQRLLHDMLGESGSERRQAVHDHRRTSAATGRPVLEVRDLASSGRFAGVSFAAEAGEIVGLLGQIGSGADAVLPSLVGLDPAVAGDVRVDGVKVSRLSVQATRAAGISYLSESRKRDGLFVELSIQRNLTSSILGGLTRGGILRRGAEAERARDLGGAFGVDVARLARPALTLSGGNQQKVALAKAVASEPRVLLLSEPTRGVDVGARTDIYAQLRRMADAGATIVCFTSDVTEISEVCDRVVTMFRGSIVRTVEVRDGLERELLADALHGGSAAEDGR